MNILIKKPKIIKGAGGGKGGSKGPVETSDNLFSGQKARILDVVSEGEIVGLGVDPLKSVFVDGTPIQNADDSYNFFGVKLWERLGTQGQPHIEGIPGIENTVPVSVEILNGTPHTETVTDSTVDDVLVAINVPALVTTNHDTGDITGGSVRIQILIDVDGGGFNVVLDKTISGKTTNGFTKDYLIELPAGTTRKIRVVRVTEDSNSALIQNKTIWISYTTIKNEKLTYPNSALYGIEMDSTQFSAIPTRGYLIKGIKVPIPDNYDPLTRIYSPPVWGGVFVTDWTDNPAWIFYDLATNERYGLGQFITPALTNKFDLFAIGQYCDTLVDDGFGGQEPRFTCNTQIQNATEAYQLLVELASVFRGMPYWAGGQLTAVQDSPASAIALFNATNVEDGDFEYSGSSISARHTVALVTWNDPDNLYKQEIEYVENPAGIDRYGVREKRMIAIGATSRGQAHRVGLWALYSEVNETEIVSFTTGYQATMLFPGAIIQIQDPNKTAKEFGGRISSGAIGIDLIDAANPPAWVFEGNATLDGLEALINTLGVTENNITLDIVDQTEVWAEDKFTFDKLVLSASEIVRIMTLFLDGTNDFSIQITDNAGTLQFRSTHYDDAGVSNVLHSQKVEVGVDYHVKMHFKQATTTISNDGIIQIWINDELILDIKTVDNNSKDIKSICVGSVFGGHATADIKMRAWNINAGTTGNGIETDIIPLDQSVVLEVGKTYSLNVIHPDGTVDKQLVSNTVPGTYDVLTVSTAFGALPQLQSIWVLESDIEIPTEWKVLSVSEGKGVTRQVMAKAHDATKFSQIESGIILTTKPLDIRLGTISAPTNLIVDEYLTTANGEVITVIRIQWDDVSKAETYNLRWKRDNENWVGVSNLQNNYYEIWNAVKGIYTVQVTALDGKGLTSIPTQSAPTQIKGIDGLTLAPNVSGLELFGQGNENEFIGRDAKFEWRKAANIASFEIGSEPATEGADAGSLDAFFKDYEIRMYDNDTSSRVLLRTEHVTDNFYTYTWEKNVEDSRFRPAPLNSVPRRTFVIEVFQRNINSALSAFPAKLLVLNPAPQLPTEIFHTKSVYQHFIRYTQPLDHDWIGMIVWRSLTSGFTPNPASRIYKGQDTFIVIEGDPGTTYYYRFATYDAFDEVALIISGEHIVIMNQIVQVDIDPIVTFPIPDLSITNEKIAELTLQASKLAPDSVVNSKIINDAITAAKILDGAVIEAKILNNAITTAKLQTGAVTNAKIAALTITEAEIAALAITTAKILDGAISETKILNNSISTPKLQAGSVTANEIQANTITAAQIQALAITVAELAVNSVTADKILAGTITANEIQALSITAAVMAVNSITADKIVAGSISTVKLQADSVTTNKLAANSVTAVKIQALAITAAKIAANTITAGQIQANSITSTEILANTITALEIAANTISAAEMIANTITSNEIAAGAITTSELAANAVTAAKILANTITANEIQANTITGAEIVANTITGAHIFAATITADKYFELRNSLLVTAGDSLDISHPFIIPFPILTEMIIIRGIRLTFQIQPYRAYSTGAAAGGQQTTSAGGATVPTTTLAGAQTSSFTNVDHTHGIPVAFTPVFDPGGIRYDIFNAPGQLRGFGQFTTGFLIATSLAGGGSHSHTVANHNHQVTIGNHNHTIQNHTHPIIHGIFEENNSPSIDAFVDNGSGFGLSIGTWTANQFEINIASHFSGSGFKKLKFTSTLRTRIFAVIELKLDIAA